VHAAMPIQGDSTQYKTITPTDILQFLLYLKQNSLLTQRSIIVSEPLKPNVKHNVKKKKPAQARAKSLLLFRRGTRARGSQLQKNRSSAQ
jgi:hypothetical protein